MIYTFSSVGLGLAFATSLMYHIPSSLGIPAFVPFILSAIVGSISIGLVIRRYIGPKFLLYSVKHRIILFSGSILMGIWLVVAIPLFIGFQDRKDILLFICDTLTLSFVSFSLCMYLFSRPLNKEKPIEIPAWNWLLYTFPIIGVWVLFLLAYWPGSLSFDSIYQWEQMTSFKFTDWHPVFHTLTNWLITRIWASPAAIAFTQIVAMASVLGWGLAEQQRYRAPRWLPWLTIIVIATIPSNGLIVITLWKDVFYSIAVVALTILIFKIAMSHGWWIKKPYSMLILTFTSALVALFRHNGAPVAFLTLACLLVFYHRFWTRFLIVLMLTFAAWFGIRWPVYDALGVDRISAMSSQPGVGMALVHLLSRYTNSDTQFLPEERLLLLKIRPEEKWPYECHLETDLFFTKLNWINLRNYTPDLAALATKMILRNPRIFVDHVICTSSFLYQITRTPGSLYEPIETGVYTNNFGIARESKLLILKNIIDRAPNQSDQSFNWLFWRVPFWSYLLLFGIVIYGTRAKNWKLLLVFVPVFLNMLPFVVMAVLQSFRYVYPTLIVSALMSGFFLFTNTYPEGEKNSVPRTGM